MKRGLWVGMLYTAAAFAGEQMHVAVCNLSQVPGTLIERAKAEATYLFATMNIDIHWTACGGEIAAEDARQRPDFVMRVQADGHITKSGPASLEAMGRAFLDTDGVGYLADAYFGAIHDLTAYHPDTGSDEMLGYVLAHELGHLLIGPGHRPNGIMRAAWGRKEFEAIRQRHLKFNAAERATMLRNLRMRNAN